MKCQDNKSVQKCPNFRHPLVHNGVNQNDRLCPELLPDYVQLDDRDSKTFLNFAYEYAALIKYFNEQNQENGNWQCFFSGGALGILSVITSIDLAAIDDKYCRAEVDFWEALDEAEPDERDAIRAAKYQILIDCIYELAKKIDRICKELLIVPALRQEVLNIIKQDIQSSVLDNRIQNALIKLIAYDKGNRPTIINGDSDPFLEEKYSCFILSSANDSDCIRCWGVGDLDDFYCITPDDGFMEIQDTNDCKENRNLRNLFFVFFQALAKIIRRAEFYLQRELADSHAQEPQISLFLSFIFLFRRLLGQLNQLTEAHLDFYYQQVLCIPNNPLRPDQVFVVFELAKNFSEFHLVEGTLLDAKNDDEGNKLQYGLDSQIFVNKAKVEACSALYLKLNEEGDGYEKVYSIDSLQESGTKNNLIKWVDFRDSNLDNFAEREVGVAVSDPILNLAEGTRFIVLYLEADRDLPFIPLDLNTLFKVYISSDLEPSGWMTLPAVDSRAFMDFLDVPSKAAKGGLTSNINHATQTNAYNNVTESSFSVRYAQTDLIEIRMVVKKDSFPISIPLSAADPFFKGIKAPAIKVTFNERLTELLQIQNINNFRLVVEAANVQENVRIRNRLGTFNNQDTFSLLGNPAGEVLPTGPFLELDLQELRGKQLLGLEPDPQYLEDTGIAPKPSEFILGTIGASSPRFKPSFKLIDDFIEYPSVLPFNLEFPQLPQVDNFNVQLDSILRLPVSTIEGIADIEAAQQIQGLTTVQGGVQASQLTNQIVQTGQSGAQGQIILPNTPAFPGSIFQFNLFNNSIFRGPGVNFFSSTTPGSFPCIVYSALRNQNILTLEYQNPPSDYFDGRPALVKNIAFRYSSFSDFIVMKDGIIYMKHEFGRYYVTPGGYNLINPATFNDSLPLIPQYHLLPAEEDQELLALGADCLDLAHLDIGIRDLVPGQQLSLLFQMEEGTGNPNFDPPRVRWSYLAKDSDGVSDEWRPFRAGAVFQDTTKSDPESETSLLQSGIVKFTTSPQMTGNSTTIQPGSGLYWLRATLIGRRNEGERVIALPNIMAIYAQAETATFINNDNTLDQLELGLAPETITKLVNQGPAIKKVIQPLPSINGRLPEDKNAYYRRVSERLRHKNRAINIWDYERLILEEFQEVFHAKTLSHTSKNCEIDPGSVMVAVFPDLRNRPDINPFTPGFCIGKLEAIEDHLRARSNLFLYCNENIQVVNPLYELIQVKCCVRFRTGFPPLFYSTQLNNDLHSFLAPWIVNFDGDLLFSGELHTSAILNFIEEREYVDVVTHFQVCHFTIDQETGEPLPVSGNDIEGNPIPVSSDVIRTSTARSILTTYPAGHEIQLWGEPGCDDCLAEDFTTFEICIA